MSYAQRPMGDYRTYGYTGDPGFLSGLWKVIKKVAPIVIGGMIGGPMGAMAGLPQAAPKPQFPVRGPGIPQLGVAFPGGTQIMSQYLPGTVQLTPGQGRLPPFTATGAGVLPGGGRGGGMVPSGWHFAKDGSGKLVRNRRMNVANPRALRRAMRRATGFEKLAKRAINFNKRVRPARKRRS